MKFKVIKKWDSIFKNHPWVEAFCLPIIAHVFFLNFMWLCCQFHVMINPQNNKQSIIEIEFVN